MEKGDVVLIIIIIVVLVIVSIMTMNMDKLFPTPTVQEAVTQAVNAT